MIVPEMWEAFCCSAWLLTDAIWGQAKTELKRKPSRIWFLITRIKYGHSSERKCFIYASCNDSNNDKIEKPYIVLFQAYSLKVKKGIWAMNNCSWCAIVFRGLFMFSCGSIPFCKYFDKKWQVERRPTSVFNNSFPGCIKCFSALLVMWPVTMREGLCVRWGTCLEVVEFRLSLNAVELRALECWVD